MTAPISAAAKASFELLVQTALRRALSAEGQSAGAQSLDALPVKMAEEHAVVLTVSSYKFRLLVALYYCMNEETKGHFALLNKQEMEGWSDEAFLDALRECGNIACGAINRDLGLHFPHVGMSTPNVLSIGALAYAGDLGSSFTQHLLITGLPVEFHASLYVAADEPLDFKAEEESLEDNADTGEMEMF